MEIIKVGIYLKDRIFARALALGLARESRTMNFVLLDNLDRKGDFDMILTWEDSGEKRDVQLIWDKEAESLSSPPYRLYQYKESPAMIDDLLFIYFKMTDRVLEYRGSCKCRLVTFVSDAGRSGTTMTCIAAAKMLNQLYGSKTLYLNLCPIDDSKKYLKDSGEKGLLKLLYYLDTGKEFPLQHFITRGDDMDYVSTTAVNSYFNDMKPSLMNVFLKKVDLLGLYDYLFIDMGSCLSRQNRKLLENADLIITVHNGENETPPQYYEHISREILKNTVGTKALNIENFAGDDWREDVNDRLCISKDPKAVCFDETEGLLRIDLSGNYGMEVAAAAKKIVEEI